MTNYRFRKGYSLIGVILAGNVTSTGVFTIDTVTSGTLLFPDRTPVRVEWTDNGRPRAFYGIYSSDSDTITYDPNVYTADTITNGSIGGFTGSDITSVESYSVNVETTVATYGKSYIPYNITREHTLNIPRRRGDFYSEINDLVYSDTIGDKTATTTCFYDLCDGYAYSISATDSTFRLLNGKYNSTLEFKVATK